MRTTLQTELNHETELADSGNNNWSYLLDSEGILWLSFNVINKSVNSLSKKAIAELGDIINKITNRSLPDVNTNNLKALIICSGKTGSFIAGADITEFTKISDIEDAKSLLENGQKTMAELENLKLTTVAMIDGFCLGGGLELALSCNYIIVSDNPSTKLGLPEVMLGIIPGWGGTVRLPKKIGGMMALPLMLQGKTVNAVTAYKFGIADACVPIRQLKRTAKYFALNKPNKRKPSLINSLVDKIYLRNIFAYFARKQLMAKIKKEHYPSPYALLDKWEKYGVDDPNTYAAEITYDLEIIQQPTTKNLISLFFLQEKLKETAKSVKFKAKHVHVIGAGTMGGDIAAWCALKGIKVTLQDQSYERLSPAIERAFKLFKKKLKRDDLANFALDNIIPDINGAGIKDADVIIEAIFEDLHIKRELFRKIERDARRDAILASNTSSILIDDINEVLTNKSRLVGIHFFNPVAKMMLVEVVSGKTTDVKIAANAASFVNQIGKLSLPVSSSPGFLVNRVLSAYMHETFILISQGMTPDMIDKAMKSFGMPMGPVEMADIVGLDICLSVARNISAYYGDEIPRVLIEKVQAKHLGKKTNKGFYDYDKGIIKRDKNATITDHDQQQIIDRLTMRILNTCVACLREGVVKEAYQINAGLVFGAGFAPFRGGPIEYLHTIGKENVVNKLMELSRLYGERFEPDPGFDQSLFDAE